MTGTQLRTSHSPFQRYTNPVACVSVCVCVSEGKKRERELLMLLLLLLLVTTRVLTGVLLVLSRVWIFCICFT